MSLSFCLPVSSTILKLPIVLVPDAVGPGSVLSSAEAQAWLGQCLAFACGDLPGFLLDGQPSPVEQLPLWGVVQVLPVPIPWVSPLPSFLLWLVVGLELGLVLVLPGPVS